MDLTYSELTKEGETFEVLLVVNFLYGKIFYNIFALALVMGRSNFALCQCPFLVTLKFLVVPIGEGETNQILILCSSGESCQF